MRLALPPVRFGVAIAVGHCLVLLTGCLVAPGATETRRAPDATPVPIASPPNPASAQDAKVRDDIEAIRAHIVPGQTSTSRLTAGAYPISRSGKFQWADGLEQYVWALPNLPTAKGDIRLGVNASGVVEMILWASNRRLEDAVAELGAPDRMFLLLPNQIASTGNAPIESTYLLWYRQYGLYLVFGWTGCRTVESCAKPRREWYWPAYWMTNDMSQSEVKARVDAFGVRALSTPYELRWQGLEEK